MAVMTPELLYEPSAELSSLVAGSFADAEAVVADPTVPEVVLAADGVAAAVQARVEAGGPVKPPFNSAIKKKEEKD